MAKKPEPRAVPPEAVADLARAVMREARFPMLATVDQGQPRVRPVSPVRVEDFVVYVANLKHYHKTLELAAEPRVELCYLSPDHDQVRITGRAEAVDDAGLLASIWADNPLLRHYLGSPDNPDLVIYRICPLRVRFMREWALEYHEVPLRPQTGGAGEPA